MKPHDVEDCRPLVLEFDDALPGHREIVLAAVRAVWETLPETHRRAFHEYCCRNRRGLLLEAMVTAVVTQVRREVDTQVARHRTAGLN